MFIACEPRVARSSQPWALGRTPVGLHHEGEISLRFQRGRRLITVSHSSEGTKMIKVFSGIAGGIVLWCFGMVGGFFLDPHRDFRALWVGLSLLGWGVLAWGMSHFAKYRGHQGAVGCGLLMIGLFVELFIVIRAFNIWAYTIGFFFVAALPIGAYRPQRRHRERHR